MKHQLTFNYASINITMRCTNDLLRSEFCKTEPSLCIFTHCKTTNYPVYIVVLMRGLHIHFQLALICSASSEGRWCVRVDRYVLVDSAMHCSCYAYCSIYSALSLLKRSSPILCKYFSTPMAANQNSIHHCTEPFGVIFMLGGPGSGKGTICPSIASVTL